MATADLGYDTAGSNFFMQIPLRQKIMAMVGLAAAVALVVGLVLWGRTPDYGLLFANLDDKDGGAVILALQQQNIPYRFAGQGGGIMVPSHLVPELRLRLATQGIPKGGSNGFELLEGQRLGLSQFNEQVNYQRALEGELGRSIQTLVAVASARVHLAIPRQTGFLRESQKATASVVLHLRGGNMLEPGQIAGIVHLVSASVPQLAPQQVSVIDQNGNLLSQPKDASQNNAMLDANQLKYTKEIEANYIKRIENILTPVVGVGNARAQVTAEMDFSQSEQTAETFRPLPPDQGAIRSQQIAESNSRGAGAGAAPGGVPGALSNQPPAPATAPITNNDKNANLGMPGANNQSSKNSTTNYELDKTVKFTRLGTGQVKRLAVAVAVNYAPKKDSKGVLSAAPLDEAQMKQINELVQEAVGLNKQRGDTIAVANTRFVEEPKEPVVEIPLWERPDIIALGKDGFKYLIIGLAVLYVIFGIIRPLLRQALKTLPPPVAEKTDDAEEIPEEDPRAQAAKGYEEKLTEVKAIAQQDPRMVANVIKEWSGGGAA